MGFRDHRMVVCVVFAVLFFFFRVHFCFFFERELGWIWLDLVGLGWVGLVHLSFLFSPVVGGGLLLAAFVVPVSFGSL